MPRVFVYGSLRTGFNNRYLLQNSEMLGIYKTLIRLYMIGLKSRAYPYVTTDQLHPTLVSVIITGELYEVSVDVLERLDELEGHPNFYKRTEVNLYSSELQKYEKAEMYVLESDEIKKEIAENFEKSFESVESGDWLKFNR
jgi:gamma-glutamylaminecyclotransferase